MKREEELKEMAKIKHAQDDEDDLRKHNSCLLTYCMNFGDISYIVFINHSQSHMLFWLVLPHALVL